jgi:ATP-dependent RNA helicase DeaD
MSTSLAAIEPKAEPTGFAAMNLGDDVRRALDEIGYTHPTPVQEATYAVAIEGRDIIVQARTGTGKTAAFGIPLVDKIVSSEPFVQALVLAPTRELALQSQREIARLGQHKSVRATAVYGGAPMGKQIDDLREGCQIVSGTPGRVLDHLRRGTFDASRLRVLVLDEMDEMLSMGFAKELNAILELIPDSSKRQTMCFSATVDGDVRRTAERHMRNPEMISLSSDGAAASQITHHAYMVPGSDRASDLVRILEVEDPESAIIFCNMRSETERVAQVLKQAGFNADWLNGDLPQKDRERIMGATREGKLRYLVATDVAARGIDISHLTHVINYTFPESAAVYVHRTGRTGRAGRTGCAISLISPDELGRLYYLRLEYKLTLIERSLPTRGELNTRKEIDRIALLEQAFAHAPASVDLALARRLLTHPDVERILAGLVHTFLGTRDDVDEEAAAARRSRRPDPIPEPPVQIEARPRARFDRNEPSERDRDRDRDRDRPAARRPHRDERPTREQSRPRLSTPNAPVEESAVPSAGPSDSHDSATGSEDQTHSLGDRPVGILYLNVGKRDGVRVGEIARIVRESADLPREDVGRIRVRDRYTFVDVPLERLDDIIVKLAGQKLNDKDLGPERAKSSGK